MQCCAAAGLPNEQINQSYANPATTAATRQSPMTQHAAFRQYGVGIIAS